VKSQQALRKACQKPAGGEQDYSAGSSWLLTRFTPVPGCGQILTACSLSIRVRETRPTYHPIASILHLSFQKWPRDNLQIRGYLAEIIFLKSSDPADHSATGAVIGTCILSFFCRRIYSCF